MILTTQSWPARCRRLLPALALLAAASACAPRLAPPAAYAIARQKVATLAQSLAGVPYVYGGSDIDGFDCSGLVFYVYDCFGIRLPRSAGAQADLRGAVSWKRAEAGDILAFRLDSGWHSAIYLGEGRFIHAPSAGERVRVETLNDFWLRRLRAVIALLPPGR
jgi:cell wall-associated NlpC family hydrolase